MMNQVKNKALQKNIDIITEYLSRIYHDVTNSTLDIDSLDDEFKDMGRALIKLQENISELHRFGIELAEGDLSTDCPRRDIILSGPLKDLQANLRHLTWQALRVAEGDYDQRVDYLGEFSDAFNKMTSQLKARTLLMEENARMERELAENKAKTLESELSHQISYYNRVTELTNEAFEYRHDIKNHFLALDSLLSEGKLQDAREYLLSISPQVFSKEWIVRTDNYIFDALVSEKLGEAEKQGVEIQRNITLSRRLNIENADWCILLGNALDNAIEATTKICDIKPQIFLQAKDKGNMVSIMIKNTAPADLEMQDGEFKTTKEDQPMHGIGLKNIAKVVEKYNGVMSLSCEDRVFTFSCLLCDV